MSGAASSTDDHAHDLHEGVGDRLRSVDQRFTPLRRRLVDVLDEAPRPLTMPELLERGSGPQSSVYRNLVVLEQAGVVRRIVTDDEFARFELAEDLTGHHHHHLVCTSCGAVEDFTVPSAIEEVLEGALVDVVRGQGFAVESHRLDLLGRCRDCHDA